MTDVRDVPEFLNVTLYVNDISDLRAFYRDFLQLPVDYEEPGHATVMGEVAVHDPSEAPAGRCRLYFLVDDPESFANRAADHDIAGVLRSDGYGDPAWESMDPFGNSVVLLKRRRPTEETR